MDGVELVTDAPAIRLDRGMVFVTYPTGKTVAIFPHDFLRMLEAGRRAVIQWQQEREREPIPLREAANG